MPTSMHKQKITPDGRDTSVAPYSPAIAVGDMVFVSGQGPINFDTMQFECTTIENETHLTLQNVRSVLAEADCSMEDVVKVNIYLQNIHDFDKVNSIYREYFDEPWPARTTVQAVLGSGISVEIDATAIRGCGTNAARSVDSML